MSAKPVSYIPQSARLLDQLREVLRYKHYSLRTEEAYLYWVKFFVRWHGRNGQVQHPRDMGAAEVQQFLAMLTTQRNVSVSTHNQALSALLFLYREVLGVKLPWLDDVQRPTRPRRIPSVLTVTEVAALLGAMTGVVHAHASSADTICTRSVCSEPSNWLVPQRKFTSRYLCIPCAILLPRICCNRVPTFARCKSCWGTATCPPP